MSASCKHLRRFRNRTGRSFLDTYKLLCQAIVYPSSVPARQKKVAGVKCTVCEKRDSFLLLCLECVYFGCIEQDHFAKHFEENSDHYIGVEASFGQLYCCQCKDFVYDKECEDERRREENRFRASLGFSLRFAWNPGRSEVEMLKNGRKRALRVSADSTLGLRGLVNLGNTCFMSCILQALTHTPLLRDYFMSDQHRCNPHTARNCLMCEMANIFQEFYSGSTKPHIPYRMLHLVWTHARHLAGYEQQDAHEFFMAALDVLHRHSRSSNKALPHQCQCIIDRIFTGRLQSDVTCQTCSGVSTTLDPYWDISLDLGSNMGTPGSSGFPAPRSLQECLERFTRTEHLGCSAKCSNCDAYEESTKQLTLRKLPIVACFHLKRFEHSTKLHKKINTFVSFPQYLDMTPFTSEWRDSAQASEADQGSLPTPVLLDRLKNKYALFAVVNHKGTLESGHYTAFVRQRAGDWYKCDDHVITPASIQTVLESEGYLLFYHKQFIDYD